MSTSGGRCRLRCGPSREREREPARERWRVREREPARLLIVAVIKMGSLGFFDSRVVLGTVKDGFAAAGCARGRSGPSALRAP